MVNKKSFTSRLRIKGKKTKMNITRNSKGKITKVSRVKKDKCAIKSGGKGYKYLVCNGMKVAGYSPKRGMWGATKYFPQFEKLMKTKRGRK